MYWLVKAARRLRKMGVLGMNRRNANCILDLNPRSRFPLVDDKIRLSVLCQQMGVPVPEIYAQISSHSQLHLVRRLLEGRNDFVVKPNHGSGGRGVMVIVGRADRKYVRSSGRRIADDVIRQHMSDILSGMYSIGGQPDHVIVQQRVRLHSAFEAVVHAGIPDVRVVVYRNEPAMAMLRLPTSISGGRANLHQGGIGVGIDLSTGLTHHAVHQGHFIAHHPDTGSPLVGLQLPFWDQVVGISRRVARAVELGYIGIDVVIDQERGPLLLEANARPGLAIQIANGQGLVPRLQAIDDMLARPRNTNTPRYPQARQPQRVPQYMTQEAHGS